MNRSLLFLILGLLLTKGNAWAQSLNEPGFTHYTRTEGLSNNLITGIVQDSLGYIWLGTGKGLNRFDGRFFTSYYSGSAELSLPGDHIKRLKRQGSEIMGATNAGAFVLNANSHRYQQLIVPCQPLLSYWANDVVDLRRDKRGELIVSTRTGLYIFDSTGQVLNRYDRHSVADVGKVEIWWGQQLYEQGNGVILQENQLLLSGYDPDHGTFDTFYTPRHPRFKKAITNRDGGQWVLFAGPNDELFCFNEYKNALDWWNYRGDSMISMPMPFDGNAELENYNQIFSLGDSLWAMTCSTSGFYIMEYHATTHRLTLSGKKRFAGKQVKAILKDRDGRLWVGTDQGLYKENLHNPLFTGYDLAAVKPALHGQDIHAIWADREHIFIGLRNNGSILVLNKLSKRLERQIFLGRSDSNSNEIKLLFPYSADTLWVGTGTGLFWLHRSNFSHGRVAVPPALAWLQQSNALCFLGDRNGNIWLSFNKLNTVIRYHRATREFTEISRDKYPLLRVTFCFSLAEDSSGNIWLGGDGICRWNPVKQSIDTLIAYSPAVTKSNNYLLLLGGDEHNNLWLYSLDNGIVQYNCGDGHFSVRKEESDLTDGNVLTNSGIINHHIWLGVENGIYAFDIRDYTSRMYPFTDTLSTMTVATYLNRLYYDEENKTFFFASGLHLVSFRPDLAGDPQPAPSLFIDGIHTPDGTLNGYMDKVEVSYANNFVQLNFNAINYANPEGNRFAYQVMPSADSSWHLLNWQRSILFNNLAPGAYHVRLKLFSDNDRWAEQFKALVIVVHPPFWKNGWFIAAVIALCGLFIVAFYRYRVGRIREKLNLDKQIAEYEMKALHAQMNPHFIFNALNSIREMILEDENRNASRYLGRFAQLIRLNLDHSRQTFITLEQNIEYLKSYLEMEQLRFDDFSYVIDIAPEVNYSELRIAPMLIQPLVENAIWHGLLPKDGDKKLLIRFFLREDNLVCEIEDNGIGILQSMQDKDTLRDMHQSVGIDNIRQRIAVLNEKYETHCKLTIIDKSAIPGRTDGGTIATLILPAHEEELVTEKNSI